MMTADYFASENAQNEPVDRDRLRNHLHKPTLI